MRANRSVDRYGIDSARRRKKKDFTERGISMMDTDNMSCMEVFGYGADGVARCCGKTVVNGSSWCEEHRRKNVSSVVLNPSSVRSFVEVRK